MFLFIQPKNSDVVNFDVLAVASSRLGRVWCLSHPALVQTLVNVAFFPPQLFLYLYVKSIPTAAF